MLNGEKLFVCNGRRTGLAVVFAVTDRSGGKNGISAFIVPADAPGFVKHPPERKLGMRASDTCAISFDDCRIPPTICSASAAAACRSRSAISAASRTAIAAQATGIARAALEASVRYAKERVQFGKPIIEHQSVANLLADMQVQAERRAS